MIEKFLYLGGKNLYIVIGNEIVDSEELKIIIDKNSEFKVEKDLSKSTKEKM